MFRRLYLSALFICLFAAIAWADPQIPADAQRELSSQTNILSNKDKKIREKLGEKPEIEITKETEAKNDEEGPVFFIKKINIEGNRIIPSRDFESLIPAFENRKTSFRQLKSLAEIITNVYRSQGYVTSRAYLPPQTVDNGIVTIKVIEGKVGKVLVDGNKYFSARSYQRRMKFDSGIFRYQDLESALYYLNQLPDRQAKAFLIPGEELASSDIILKVKDKNPFHAYYDFSNRGTKLTHRERHGVHLDNNNFLGMDDVLNTTYTTTAEGAFEGGSFSYSLPVGDTPLTASLTGGYVRTRLVGFLKEAKITGQSLSLEPGLTYAFIQRPEKEISLYAGFEYVNSISAINGVRTSVDRMRSLQVGPRITLQDTGGRSIIYSDAHIGLPGFLGGLETDDANASVNNSGGDFTFYTVNLVRLQRLPAGMFLIARLGGQWTPDTLSSVEQYRAGGSLSVRGYPESDAAGDYGWSGGTELSYPASFIPKDWVVPFTKKPWANSLRLVGFLDAAKTYLRERPLSTTAKDKLLIGTGFGFRLDIDEYVSAQLDMGYPIGDDSTDKNNPQVHFAMKAGF